MSVPAPAAPTVVLDTNAVLDWLVFRNPEFEPLGAAIVAGDVRWIATPWMREELAHVLARGHLDAWSPDRRAVEACWERHCAQQPAPAPASPQGKFRCSDPDDQPFIDLARTAGARWLVSRDRAVLKLARRLREHGVLVIPPGAWRPPVATD
jgi:predicted nucleic acid-binding protein